MFAVATGFAGQGALQGALALLALVLALLYRWQQRSAAQGRYSPRLAWLRAGLYFCFCLLVASFSGVLATVIHTPLATAAQLADLRWWALTLACAAVIAIAYAVIWPRGTFTDGRRLHPLLTLVYGSVWGICQGLLFLSMWALVQHSGLGVWWVALISYFLIGAYNGCWHHFFWDIHVSPPHNYSEWNGRKVLFCHTPNLLLCLSYLALYGNAGIYLLLQGAALAASAWFMRFPAFWDDYSAAPGRERSIAEKVQRMPPLDAGER